MHSPGCLAGEELSWGGSPAFLSSDAVPSGSASIDGVERRGKRAFGKIDV